MSLVVNVIFPIFIYLNCDLIVIIARRGCVFVGIQFVQLLPYGNAPIRRAAYGLELRGNYPLGYVTPS